MRTILYLHRCGRTAAKVYNITVREENGTKTSTRLAGASVCGATYIIHTPNIIMYERYNNIIIMSLYYYYLRSYRV